MKSFALVGLGGLLGAMARYAVALAVARVWTRRFPLGTFVINVTGSFVLGVVLTLATEHDAVPPAWRLVLTTGFLGAYTTFSTFEYETHQLTQTGTVAQAALNVVASVLAGFLAVRLGVRLAR